MTQKTQKFILLLDTTWKSKQRSQRMSYAQADLHQLRAMKMLHPKLPIREVPCPSMVTSNHQVKSLKCFKQITQLSNGSTLLINFHLHKVHPFRPTLSGFRTIISIIWYGMVWYGMVWYGMVWYGMVWYGMVWYGMVWYGMVWYGMV